MYQHSGDEMRVFRYYARRRKEREDAQHAISMLIVLFLWFMAWLVGDVIVAIVLSLFLHTLNWWEWLLVVFAVSIVLGRITKMFKK